MPKGSSRLRATSTRSVKRGARATRGNGQSRLSFDERERQIIDGALKFFSEEGFAGGTRELSTRLGVTQPLLYRYFPSKRALIKRVYEEVFLRRVDPQWIAALRDRSQSLDARLLDFYRHYADATYQVHWIRLYFHTALAGLDLNARYVGFVEQHLLRTVCTELRADLGLPPPSKVAISRREMELVWKLHAGMFYWAVRRFIYRSQVLEDFATVADDAIQAYLAGARRVLPRILAAANTRLRRRAQPSARRREGEQPARRPR
jgi:AcrR family transcriptional regulator